MPVMSEEGMGGGFFGMGQRLEEYISVLALKGLRRYDGTKK